LYKLHLVGYVKYTSSDARLHERYKIQAGVVKIKIIFQELNNNGY